MKNQYKVLAEKYMLVGEGDDIKVDSAIEALEKYKDKLMYASSGEEFINIVKDIYLEYSPNISNYLLQKRLGEYAKNYLIDLAKRYPMISAVEVNPKEIVDIDNVYYYFVYLQNALTVAWGDAQFLVHFSQGMTPEEIKKLIPSGNFYAYWNRWHMVLTRLNKAIKEYEAAQNAIKQQNKKTGINLDI